MFEKDLSLVIDDYQFIILSGPGGVFDCVDHVPGGGCAHHGVAFVGGDLHLMQNVDESFLRHDREASSQRLDVDGEIDLVTKSDSA